jgi:hypothetical protein
VGGASALALAAGLTLSAAPAARADTPIYDVVFQNPSGGLGCGFEQVDPNQFDFGQGTCDDGPETLAPGTSPSVTPTGNPVSPSGEASAWVDSSGIAEVFFAGVITDLGAAAPDTSPSIVALTNGGVAVAFVQSSGEVAVYDSFTRAFLDEGIAAPGTSPSLASLPGGVWEVAFHGAAGHLITGNDEGALQWDLGLWPGTSPGMTGLANGQWEVAFEAAGTADLWTWGSDKHGDWKLGIAPGTNPAIVGLSNGRYEVAFQAAGTGHLWTVGSDNHDDWKLGIAPGTSPAITIFPNGGHYEVAFQAAGTGHVWSVGYDVHGDWGLPMRAGTNPAITPAPWI